MHVEAGYSIDNPFFQGEGLWGKGEGKASIIVILSTLIAIDQVNSTEYCSSRDTLEWKTESALISVVTKLRIESIKLGADEKFWVGGDFLRGNASRLSW